MTRPDHAKSFISLFVTLVMLFGVIANITSTVYAGSKTENFIGKYYEFDKKNSYDFSTATPYPTDGKTFGSFITSGSYTKSDNHFTMQDGALVLSYSFDESKLNVSSDNWHIVEDSSKKIGEHALNRKIKNGAIIIEASLDGKEWDKVVELTDIFVNDSVLKAPVYETKPVQQQNGCYFRVIIAYEMERAIANQKKGKESKRIAEVYEFDVVDKDTGEVTSAADTPRKELGSKIKTEKDSGYSGIEDIDINDPHYGWDLGVFTVNGYTQETKDDEGNPVFLKNVGDKVALWFTLKQDIDQLNGNPKLSIADDTGAYDRFFEIDRTNFGRGALIIRYTDYEGVEHAPVIYTNYLAANAKTGADKKVQLFEEGDYVLSLDYEIKEDDHVITLPTHTDYKISFSFSIRNGNCMVFPFDVKTQNELSDNDLTENGFKLDMAKSRYLTINVKKESIKENSDHTISLDVRFNRPAKDNEEYTDSGIYTFTVKNHYKEGETTKTIYVGDDAYTKALAKPNMTVDSLNEKILAGATVNEDGSITEAKVDSPEIQEEPIIEAPVEPPVSEQPATSTPPHNENSSDDISNDVPAETRATENNETPKSPTKSITIIAVAVAVLVFFVIKKKPSQKPYETARTKKAQSKEEDVNK